ncbi:TetR family transcriptional regulator [Bordetella tumbae]|uniref:TetR/AcrR family transcriptional regulator n=1 Tax=Bordetella tumbae TaxID=1649139 RepID=UPI0039F07ED0
MARPREFDEDALLDAVMHCFWSQGYEATSVKDLTCETGITAASLYNAYGDKRGLFRVSLDRYLVHIMERIKIGETLPPREAIAYFFEQILNRSLNDREHKGCMLVNSALELAPHDPEFRKVIADALKNIEMFFLRCITAGQADGTVTRVLPAAQLARHLLSVLMGVRVLARARPEKALLEGAVTTALTLLRG